MAHAEGLRPADFNEFVGQEALRNMLHVRIEAAREDGRPLDHILLAAPPGFGKTSLASVIASAMNDAFTAIKMPVSVQALERTLRDFEPGILFIDEAHSASKAVQESLLTVLEDGYYATKTGREFPLPWITVIAATTEPEKVIPPLYDRFPIRPTIDPYSDEEMSRILAGMADKIGLQLPDELAAGIAKAAAGTPRNARQLVFAARDLTLANAGTSPTIAEVLDFCQLDPDGLSVQHHSYLHTLDALGGNAGLSTLSALLRLHPTFVRNMERLLLERGLIELHATGRELSNLGVITARGNKLRKVS